MTTLREAAQQALKILNEIVEGCVNVKSESDIHKDAKDLSIYVRKDCFKIIRLLEASLSETKQGDA